MNDCIEVSIIPCKRILGHLQAMNAPHMLLLAAPCSAWQGLQLQCLSLQTDASALQWSCRRAMVYIRRLRAMICGVMLQKNLSRAPVTKNGTPFCMLSGIPRTGLRRHNMSCKTHSRTALPQPVHAHSHICSMTSELQCALKEVLQWLAKHVLAAHCRARGDFQNGR